MCSMMLGLAMINRKITCAVWVVYSEQQDIVKIKLVQQQRRYWFNICNSVWVVMRYVSQQHYMHKYVTCLLTVNFRWAELFKALTNFRVSLSHDAL